MKLLITLFLFSITLFANIGSISMLKNKATITRDGDIFNAQIGDNIQEGDRLNTFANSKIQIILNDDTVITLGKQTEYIISSYGSDNDPHANMRLNRGFFKAITGKIGKMAPDRFKLETRNSTIGIRGTGWITYVDEDVENTLCFKGVITVKTADKTFDIPEGNMLLMKDGVFKKYKADMNFFNSEIKRIESKAKINDSQKNQLPVSDEDSMYMDDLNENFNQASQILKKDSSLKISVVGQGVAPLQSSSSAQAYAMAKRAAIADAYRLIAERTKGVKVEGLDTIKNMMVKRSTVRTQISGIINNANIVGTKYKDGLCEVEMEIELHYNDF